MRTYSTLLPKIKLSAGLIASHISGHLCTLLSPNNCKSPRRKGLGINLIISLDSNRVLYIKWIKAIGFPLALGSLGHLESGNGFGSEGKQHCKNTASQLQNHNQGSQ